MDVIQRLDLFLAEKAWTTADLARATGLAHSTISKIRRGHRSAGLVVALRIQDVSKDWSEGPIRIAEWSTATHFASSKPASADSSKQPRRRKVA